MPKTAKSIAAGRSLTAGVGMPELRVPPDRSELFSKALFKLYN